MGNLWFLMTQPFSSNVQTIKKTENRSLFPSPLTQCGDFFLETPGGASEVPSKGAFFCSKDGLSITVTHPSWLENPSLVSPPVHQPWERLWDDTCRCHSLAVP